MHSDIVIKQLERMLKVPLVRGSGCHSVAGRTVALPKGWNIVSKRCGRPGRWLLPRKDVQCCRLKLNVLKNGHMLSASSYNTAP